MNYVPQTHHRFSRIPDQRRVVITGVGAVSAAGIGAPLFWEALLEGRSGIGPITRFDPAGIESRIAGEVRDFNPAKLIEHRLKPKRMARQSQFAVVAAAEAVRDAGLSPAEFTGRRVGVIVGSAICALDAVTESALRMQSKGVANGNPIAVLMGNLHAAALAVADSLSIEKAFAMGISTACISGVDAIKIGCDCIRAGRFDTVICGGTDAPVSRTPWAEFTIGGLNATRNDEPTRAVRPFDRDRVTGLLAEGGGIVVIENEQTALDRGAEPYAAILGDHSCIDPDKESSGSGFAPTMRGALENAGCKTRDIDFISAWGCGHYALDRTETQAIKEVFGKHAYDLAVSSIKGVIGSPLAAAGALQVIAMSLSHRHGVLPPTVNNEFRDIDCDLDYVAGRSRPMNVRRSMLNAHGLGGGNTSMILGKPA